MKTSIATVSISGNLVEKLDAIAAAGFDGIEIFEQDFLTHDGSPADVGRMIRDRGLEITLFQPFRDFECLPEPLRSRAFDRAERKFDVMQDLGADLVLICSSVHPASLGGIDRAADDLAELGDRAARRGLRVGYEALAWGRHVSDHRDAWEIVRRADHPQIGLILDSFHTLGRRIDPETIRSIPGDRIFFVQVADAPLIEMDLLYWSRHFRNMPGEGGLDVTRFMRAVMATGYGGPVSLEIFNDQFRGGRAPEIARDGYRALVALMDDVRRAEPEGPAGPPALPARVRPGGVAFVEFAAQGDEAAALAVLLRQLGFRLAGRHRNKALTLWTQGAIRIVVNGERAGHAGHAWTARGLSVCDIGLRVASAADTVARATALGAAPFRQPPGPGELDIPAIRGLGGSVLHFLDDGSGLDRVWEVEFAAVEEGGTEGRLTRVDHVAQTMNYEDMLSWALFFTSLFEMAPSPMLDVIDPDGIVRSQAVADAAGTTRITLNGAESQRTLAGAFAAQQFGSAIQHLAFATDDIFAALADMVARGLELLAIPDNYYADLRTRFSLPADLLARLQAAQVLYDEEDGAAFFQAYARPTAGGLFFEIVQRAPGYRGYGAANAPFRIAAQKRAGPPKGMPRA